MRRLFDQWTLPSIYIMFYDWAEAKICERKRSHVDYIVVCVQVTSVSDRRTDSQEKNSDYTSSRYTQVYSIICLCLASWNLKLK